MPVKPVPEGYHTVTPYIIVADAVKLINFLTSAFGAVETERMTSENGRVMHAEVTIGDSRIMIGEPMGEFTAIPAGIYLYLPDVDAAYKRALAAGATSTMEAADQFYGDRSAGVRDSQGNLWWIATHVEDVAPDEMQRRAKAAMQRRSGE